MNTTQTKQNTATTEITLYALFIALVFVTTYVIQIPMPFSQGGLVHIGDIMLFTIALTFGRKKGAVAGGFGMALFDIFSAYTVWAPFTFIIRFVMGYVTGSVAFSNNRKGYDKKWNIIAVLLSLPVLIIGYYIAEGLIYGNWITPVNSIVGNLWQFIFGLIGAIPLTMVLNAIPTVKKLKNN